MKLEAIPMAFKDAADFVRLHDAQRKDSRMAHALHHTSPKGPGMKFIGTCIKCGLKDIPLSRMNDLCMNPANLTDADALKVALGLHDTDTTQ